MMSLLSRRAMIGGLAASVAATQASAESTRADPMHERLVAIETSTGGRLGVAVLDTSSGLTIGHNAHQRFPMCSTFKFLAVAAVLKRADAKTEQMDRVVSYTEGDLLDYAPVTREHLRDGGMTLGALCAAAVTYSDNTAANLILRTLGGPSGVTRLARVLGDPTTRLDRTEPTLNEALPGDPRDTTSPAAMLADMKRILLGDALRPDSRALIDGWMAASKTGADRLHAGLPPDWQIGDKTGTGHDTANEIAIIRRPTRQPILAAVYLTAAKVPAADRDAAIASVGRIIGEVYS